MKTLTIKQPWASLIAHGIKDIENRTWKTNFRGRIYIHSSAKFDKSLISSCLNLSQCERYGYEMNKINIKATNYTSEYPNNAIIGEVDIIDCVINHSSIWAEKSDMFVKSHVGVISKKPIYNWVLANAVIYDKPILNVKGKLSFWEY